MEVRINNNLRNVFETENGLKQGDELAPMFFNLALEHVIQKLPANNKDTSN